MKATLSSINIKGGNYSITIPGSKSESNRLIILKALYPNITISNISDSDDTLSLIEGIGNTKGTVDIGHAGTAMRFLTAFYASREGTNIILTGSERLQERPIKDLVDGLNNMGAEIHYLNKKGFPPLHIVGKNLDAHSVSIKADISSQYITALLLIAPSLSNRLKIKIMGDIISSPYIDMTLKLLQRIGVSICFSENSIEIDPLERISDIVIDIESDWSSASYFFSIVALSENIEITLNNFIQNSLQGDSELITIFKTLGVETIFNYSENSITIKKMGRPESNKIILNLSNTPDIAQTIAVTCFGLGIDCNLTGLKTLKIKETDRLLALKTELEKLGAEVTITEDSIEVYSSDKIISNVIINTYQDHRMAMAFSPLALKTSIEIDQANVVSKSYPTFWQDLKKVGINVLEK